MTQKKQPDPVDKIRRKPHRGPIMGTKAWYTMPSYPSYPMYNSVKMASTIAEGNYYTGLTYFGGPTFNTSQGTYQVVSSFTSNQWVDMMVVAAGTDLRISKIGTPNSTVYAPGHNDVYWTYGAGWMVDLARYGATVTVTFRHAPNTNDAFGMLGAVVPNTILNQDKKVTHPSKISGREISIDFT